MTTVSKSKAAARSVPAFLAVLFSEPLFAAAAVFGVLVGLLLVLLAVAPDKVLVVAPILGPLTSNLASALSTAGVFVFTFVGGIMTAFSAHVRLWRESQLGAFIDSQTEQAIRESRSVHGSGIAVDNLTAHLVPNVAATSALRPETSLHRRVVSAIQADAEALRYDPVQIVVERFADDITLGGPQIKVWQHVAVRLGILVTFFGLLQALVPIKDVLDLRAIHLGVTNMQDTSNQISQLIGTIVTNLSVAFGASISGLLSALLLQMALSSIGDREMRFMHALAHRVSKVQQLAGIARNDNPLARSIDVLRAELNKHKDELNAASTMMGHGFSTLAENAASVAATRDRLIEMFERQGEAATRGMQLAETLATVDKRLANLFEARLATATAASSEHARATAETIQLVGQAVIAEVRSGYGRDARRELEEAIVARLDRAVEALESQDTTRLKTATSIAQLLAIAVGLALIVVVAAGAYLYATTKR